MAGVVRLAAVALLALGGALGALAAEPPPGPEAIEKLHGRGAHYFAGAAPSPLAGIGSRAPRLRNRVVLDDDHTRAAVDHAAGRIIFRNGHSYPKRTLIGDVVLLGVGTTRAGERAPFGIHLKIEKRGDVFTARVHPHPTVRERLTVVEFDPFAVVLSDGTRTTLALTREQAARAVQEPELAARLANILLQVTDHLERAPIAPGDAEARLVDLSIGFGAPKLNLKVARVVLRSLEPSNGPLVARGALADMLRSGAWELRITSLSPFIPKEEFDRDLFVLGLEDVPALRSVRDGGLRRGQSLVVGYRDGRGFIGVDRATAAIPDPADVARAYLEFTFVGGVIARQITTLPERLAARRGARAPDAR